MTPIALAGVAALLVTMVTSADEPTAQSAVAAETLKSDDQRSRSEGLIAKQYAQIRAEFEVQRVAQLPAATKSESANDKRDGAAKAPPDKVAYCRRMVDLAKGKLVVLVFWGTWCGPCMAMVPHERELVARLKDQPFALLGVDCNDDRETARKVMAREGMTWPSWYDGAGDPGPIAKRYHVRGFPAIFVIDAKGMIRGQPHFTTDHNLVDKLLDQMKHPNPPQGASTPSSQER